MTSSWWLLVLRTPQSHCGNSTLLEAEREWFCWPLCDALLLLSWIRQTFHRAHCDDWQNSNGGISILCGLAWLTCSTPSSLGGSRVLHHEAQLRQSAMLYLLGCETAISLSETTQVHGWCRFSITIRLLGNMFNLSMTTIFVTYGDSREWFTVLFCLLKGLPSYPSTMLGM